MGEGRATSVRLLVEARELLVTMAAQGDAVRVVGYRVLRAVLRCPTGPEPEMDALDAVALASLGLDAAGVSR